MPKESKKEKKPHNPQNKNAAIIEDSEIKKSKKKGVITGKE